MDVRGNWNPVLVSARRWLAGANARNPWNHNEHFHRWILRNLPARRRAAVDVGWGTGMLAGRLAPQFAGVIGIDADECMAAAASARADRRRRLESTALSRAETGCAVWRSPIQEHLDISMNGMRILLPRCRELAQPLGPVLLAARDDERTGLVARMAMGAATEVEQRPELYAPVMDPLADVRPHRAMSASDRRTSEAAT